MVDEQEGAALSNDRSNDVDRATDLTAAWLRNPHTRAGGDDVAKFMVTIHQAIIALTGEASSADADPNTPAEYAPAVSVRKSLASPDHIISMIDGKPYKALRRHLSTNGLTPEEYRQRYGLKADYPMVAASYSEVRRNMAKKIGLGRKPGETVKKKTGTAETPMPRGRTKSASEAKAAAQSHLAGDDRQ